VLARVFFLGLLFCLPPSAHAQDGVGARQIRFRTYTPSDGLSQATSRALAQDRDGFIWIGTQDGLNRFELQLPLRRGGVQRNSAGSTGAIAPTMAAASR
jgi:ligand-binding sensor domain-containing protein